jgi:hypothetical protein
MENTQLNNPDSQHKSQGQDTNNNSESVKLNPEFEDLKQPETYKKHIQDLQQELEAKQNPFPVDVFPKAVQEIIKDTNESLNYPIDFTGASILYAVSVSIGNTHRIEIKKGWQENAVLYLSIVGRAGTNKSHPVSFALQPIEQRDNLKFQKYQSEKQEYDTISALTKKERDQQGDSEPVKPIWEQHLVTDFTPEALTDVHKFNKRGIGVYADELATWFKNFNRYNQGSEEQFWLSVWSGKAIRINRKTAEPTYIPKPFISVIGTIQPAVLNELAHNRTENGFVDRLLFIAPENVQKKPWSEKELNPVISENWQAIISTLLDLPLFQDDTDNPQPEVLRFTPEAKQLLFEWQSELTDQGNKPENEALSGINAKIEMYAVRLALILQMMRYACKEDDKQAVGIEAMRGALKLAEYFKRTAIRVHSIVNNATPLDKLPTDKQTLYNELPDTFTTSEGVEVGKSFGMAERTFKDFIKKRDLFNYPKRGEYEKLF